MSPALATLLDSLVDYAGLFPPAQLAMADAVPAHATYLTGPHRALLGRFIVPLARLGEFEQAHARLPDVQRAGWQLSVLTGPDLAADSAAIHAYNLRHPEAPIVSIEAKATTSAEIAQLHRTLPTALEVWIEIPAAAPDLAALLAAAKATGRGAKLRTGGVTPEAFPSARGVLRFLRTCHEAGLVLKATAGLHHPLRGDFRLTYATDSAKARMFGFLNLALTAALIQAGGTDADALALLEESDPAAFTLEPEAILWRGHRLSVETLATTRLRLFRSFGSCSFTEPLEGLQTLSWLRRSI